MSYRGAEYEIHVDGDKSANNREKHPYIYSDDVKSASCVKGDSMSCVNKMTDFASSKLRSS
jgi:hypothetical protein